MNPIETDLNVLDVGHEVDIDTLMARIRQHVHADGTHNATLGKSIAGLNDNALGEALVSQAEFNRAVVETLTRILADLQHQVVRQDEQTAELIAQHALLRELVLELQHDIVQASNNATLLHREFINHIESESQRVTEQLALMEQLYGAVHQETRAQRRPWFGASIAVRK